MENKISFFKILDILLCYFNCFKEKFICVSYKTYLLSKNYFNSTNTTLESICKQTVNYSPLNIPICSSFIIKDYWWIVLIFGIIILYIIISIIKCILSSFCFPLKIIRKFLPKGISLTIFAFFIYFTILEIRDFFNYKNTCTIIKNISCKC